MSENTEHRVRGVVVYQPGEPEYEQGLRYGVSHRDGWLWVRYAHDVDFVTRPNGWVTPVEFDVLAEWKNVPNAVKLTYRADEAGRHECVSLAILNYRARRSASQPELLHREPSRVSAEQLRRIPVTRLVEAGLIAGTIRRTGDGKPEPKYQLIRWEHTFKRLENQPRRTPGERLDVDHYRKVADVYRDALATGRPVEAVAAAFSVSRSTAGRWVMKARNEHHLLGRTEKGKAGEIPTKKRTTTTKPARRRKGS